MCGRRVPSKSSYSSVFSLVVVLGVSFGNNHDDDYDEAYDDYDEVYDDFDDDDDDFAFFLFSDPICDF